jgi:hypothetical protein
MDAHSMPQGRLAVQVGESDDVVVVRVFAQVLPHCRETVQSKAVRQSRGGRQIKVPHFKLYRNRRFALAADRDSDLAPIHSGTRRWWYIHFNPNRLIVTSE